LVNSASGKQAKGYLTIYICSNSFIMLRIFVLTFVFSGISLFLDAEKFPKNSKTYTVYVNCEDCSIHADVLFESANIHPKIGYTYYWYTDNEIKNTDGGFDGKLLHGEYKSFYLNKNLKEEGMFLYGLKDGIWKTWFPNGKIHEIVHYKKSRMHGDCEEYDENGNMVSKSNFKNGVLNGKMISYKKGNVDTVMVYKKGEAVPAKSSKHIDRSNNKKKSTVNNDPKNSSGVQDSVAKTPKSSVELKKVFNKMKINTKNKKTGSKTKTVPPTDKIKTDKKKKTVKDSVPQKNKPKH